MASRAVRCALNQTYPNVEVVVVIDGSDPETMNALTALDESRLRIIMLSQNVGGSEARNVGVREATVDWVAFLDDDDEWLPAKIEKQVSVAMEMAGALSFVACQFVDGGRYGKRVLPVLHESPRSSFSDFLLCRPSLFGGSGYVQTSTWLVSKQLADICPFTPGLKRNQDLDWMLRAMSIPGARFTLVMEPLSIFNSAQETGRVSKSPDWQFHYRWALDNLHYFSKKALAYFLATTCVEDAVKQGQRLSASVHLLYAMFRYGDVSLRCLLLFAYYFLCPENLRQRARGAVASIRNRGRKVLPCG